MYAFLFIHAMIKIRDICSEWEFGMEFEIRVPAVWEEDKTEV